ncbi:flagellar type III secretion system pore protein FliP [Celeribacter halophilus]|uniref:flagellar type III secretion system pore protein FliP n=1 Tax=Celeribacter halophilus TaxID=576117 RepID=UPI001C0816C1|nr:flagellar type III secretion system pore protein FliP [Celeribacter halophilus]MBU2891497.1 flagellar type III secretion system pore protein FliP [Celeribacter halophilus]MDO6509655.1 flagellar type III secretion system pore protein FliP [Celeribacter halophilus]
MRPSIFLSVLALILLLVSDPANAQSMTLDLGADGSLSARSIQLLLLITVLSIAPGIAITLTCFPFIVTVLSILRQAIGLQQSPPNMLMISLAMFLTYYVMEPVFTESWATGVRPYVNGDIPLEQAFSLSIDPFRGFMSNRIDPDTFQQLKELRADFSTVNGVSRDAPLSLLVPSFLLSEVERAFQIGFLVFLPFLIIDLVVSAILMSMGMMMVPPAIVSLPFKLAFFVVSDGWSLLSSALVRSYF